VGAARLGGEPVLQFAFADAQRRGVSGDLTQPVTKLLDSLALEQAIYSGGDDRSRASASLDNPLRLQFGVGFDDCIESNVQLSGDLAHRRQRLARAQDANLNGAFDLLYELDVERNTAM